MRNGHSEREKQHQTRQYMNVDLHRFAEHGEEQTNFELACEFGLSLHDVKTLKKKMGRN
ncbi:MULTISPECIES: hypothetical protein [Alteribacter]|uniref:hypothetical protein n=1 Tax=Alteribacter TaxID=2823237 RepID=UPI00160642A8|nr:MULTISPECIES: hypothetical protein [Alteribacter]MBM7097831.1 hypothetical protein [Alteribacter salitolerans]